MRALALAALIVPLAACSGRTEIVLGFATDLRAPDALDEVTLVVERAGVPFVNQSFTISGSAVPDNLPASFGIIGDGGDDLLIDITLTGSKNQQQIAQQQATMTLIDGQTLFYRMGITAGCVNRADCGDGETCVEGLCQSAHVDARQLPPFADALVTTVTCLSDRVTYIETDGGSPMEPSADASDCPSNLCVQGTCLRQPMVPPGLDAGTLMVDAGGVKVDAPVFPDAGVQ